MQFRKGICNAVIAVAVALACFAWMRYSSVQITEYQYAGEPLNVLTTDDIVAFNSVAVTGENVAVTGWDPWVVFDIAGQNVSCARFLYDAPSQSEFYSEMYAAGSDRYFTPDVMAAGNKLTWKNEIVYVIPAGFYESIRLDAESSYKLVSVELYEEPGVLINKWENSYLEDALVALLAAAALFVVMLFSKTDWLRRENIPQTVLFAFLEICLLMVMSGRRRLFASDGLYLTVYSITLTIITVLYFSLYKLSFSGKIAAEKAFAVIFAAVSIAYMVFFQPMSVADELTHFRAAYEQSNALMGIETNTPGYLKIRECDLDFVQRWDKQLSFSDYWDVFGTKDIFVEAEEYSEIPTEHIKSVPLGYMSAALGITLARCLNLSTPFLFYFGRLFNIMAYLICAVAAIKLMPYAKTAVMTIALLPMNLQLVASYSYDGIVSAVALLYIALVLNLAAGKSKNIKITCLLIVVLSMVLSPCKIIVYIPIIAFALVIPNVRFANKHGKTLFIASLLIASLASVIMYHGNTLIETIKGNTNSNFAESVTTYNLGYAISNIEEIIDLFVRDVSTHADFYLGSMTCQYLGWHQLSASNWFVVAFCLLVVIATFRVDDEEMPKSNVDRLLGITLFVLVVLLLQASMLFAHTPSGYGTIEGVQGRYFIPALPLLIPVLRSKNITITKGMGKWIMFIAPYLSIMELLCLLRIMPA